MRLSRSVVVALVLVSAPAFAQEDDDLLAPLAPTAGKKKPPPKAKPPPVVRPAAPPEVAAPPAAPAKSTLFVKVPAGLKGAKVYVDHGAVASSPGEALEVSAGDHLVEVKLPGYADFSKSVKAAGGKLVEVQATLEAVAGLLSVTGDPAGATVAVDGKEVGALPVSGVVLAPGDHRVSVMKDGYKSDFQTVSVQKGKESAMVARLTLSERAVTAYSGPPPTDLGAATPGPSVPLEAAPASVETPVYKRWYVWAGVAAVVAGAAAGTVVATQGSAAKPFTATDICQGPCDGCIGLACFMPRF